MWVWSPRKGRKTDPGVDFWGRGTLPVWTQKPPQGLGFRQVRKNQQRLLASWQPESGRVSEGRESFWWYLFMGGTFWGVGMGKRQFYES